MYEGFRPLIFTTKNDELKQVNIKLMTFLLGAFFYIPAVNASASSNSTDVCLASEYVKAEYQLTINSNGQKQQLTVHLWRTPKQVAIDYPDRKITELWERTANGQLHLVRYFDAYQRGIEYQPVEIGGSHDWDLKRQLVSSRFLKRMNLEKVVGEGCQQVQHLSFKGEKFHSKLKWLVKQELVRHYAIKSDAGSESWKLLHVSTDVDLIDTKFSRLSDYQTTDYTDVGDNESDPFLVKMINLGHLQHGSLGFYDSAGHSMDPHHH